MGSRCSVIKPTWAGQCCPLSRAVVPGPGTEGTCLSKGCFREGWLRLGVSGGTRWPGLGGLAGWGQGSCCCVTASDAQGGNGLIQQCSSPVAVPHTCGSQAGLFSSIKLRELGEMRAGSCNPMAHAARAETLEASKARRAIPRAAPAQHPQLMPFAARL